jgi:hypothetical protein
MCRGSSLWCSSFALVVCSHCLSFALSRICRVVALAKGVRDLSSFISFLFPFSLWLQILCVVNALIKGEIEDHVWFEDRWMVAPLCDE